MRRIDKTAFIAEGARIIKDVGKDVRFYLEESAKYKKERDRAKM